MAFYNYSVLVAPQLSLFNVWFRLTRFVFVFWMCSLQLFRAPCAWWEGYSTNLQGLGKACGYSHNTKEVVATQNNAINKPTLLHDETSSS